MVKPENHAAAVAALCHVLHIVRIHQTRPVSQAMAAGVPGQTVERLPYRSDSSKVGMPSPERRKIQTDPLPELPEPPLLAFGKTL